MFCLLNVSRRRMKTSRDVLDMYLWNFRITYFYKFVRMMTIPFHPPLHASCSMCALRCTEYSQQPCRWARDSLVGPHKRARPYNIISDAVKPRHNVGKMPATRYPLPAIHYTYSVYTVHRYSRRSPYQSVSPGRRGLARPANGAPVRDTYSYPYS